MKEKPAFDQCLAFINCELQPSAKLSLSPKAEARRRAVTISRQAGCGALAVGEKLAEYLQPRSAKEAAPWAVFDRNLVEKVLEDHHLSKRLAKFMPEDRLSEMENIIEELFGLHPPTETLVRLTADTILHLAELGNVILIGRGANIITSRLDWVFHVRLVASLERRIEHVQQFNHLDKGAALEFIRREDGGRERYLKKYFHEDITNPLLYHLVINTDLISYAEAAQIIGQAVMSRPANLPPNVAMTRGES